MYVYKDLLELAGLTTRLYTLLSTLHNLPHPPLPSDGEPDTVCIRGIDVAVPTAAAPFVAAAASESADDLPVSLPDLGDAEVPGKAASTVLVRGLSFELRAGEHLMITGSNGVGKTAVARVLAGLWAAQGSGEVQRPRGKEGVFVVPQRAYMVTGTLLDQ